MMNTETLRYAYRVNVGWKKGGTSGNTLTDLTTAQDTVERYRRDPEVTEVELLTFETRTVCVRQERFAGGGA